MSKKIEVRMLSRNQKLQTSEEQKAQKKIIVKLASKRVSYEERMQSVTLKLEELLSRYK